MNILIENKTLEREELFVQATKTTQMLSDVPKGRGSGDNMANLIIKMQEKASEKMKLINLLFELKEEIFCQLEQLPITEYEVLYDYYIHNMNLKEIASKNNKSVSWVKLQKQEGLARVNICMSKTLTSVMKLFPNIF